MNRQIMRPCGLGQYAKPLKRLDEKDDNLKVQSLVRLRHFIEALVDATDKGQAIGHLYLPGIINDSQREDVIAATIRVSLIERDLTLLLTQLQDELAKHPRG